MPAITNLGTYKIVRQLGSGLMGPVYLATSQNAYWAVRHIDETLIRTTGAMSKLVGDVLHPSLVRYKEVRRRAASSPPTSSMPDRSHVTDWRDYAPQRGSRSSSTCSRV